MAFFLSCDFPPHLYFSSPFLAAFQSAIFGFPPFFFLPPLLDSKVGIQVWNVKYKITDSVLTQEIKQISIMQIFPQFPPLRVTAS